MTNLYLFIAFVAWGSWQIIAKLCLRYLSPCEAQTVYTLSGLLFIPVYMYGRGLFQRDCSWIGFALAILASAVGTIATVAYSSALSSKGASSAVIIVAAYPILTILLAVPILGEALTWAKVCGLLMVIAGVMVAR